MVTIRKYKNIRTFKDLLIEDFKRNYPLDNYRHFTDDTIENKAHIVYLEEYFDKLNLNLKTILVERDYVDHDFLLDFSGYYVRCFKEYKRFCTRFHFFDKEFSESDFRNFIQDLESPICGKKPDGKNSILQETYLGFIVIKPLPETIIGRTCLKTYDDSDNRYYPVKRDYLVNLFGIPLTVKTLAFQEQDRTVAACATSALWSIFHGTGKLFHHNILSPVEITKIASKPLSIRRTRMLPSSGLYLEEMTQAIESVGLEPQLENAKMDNAQTEFLLKGTLYAYLEGGIPILLTFFLLKPPYKLPEKETIGHAAAVTGYNLGFDKPKPFGAHGFLLRASRINQLYVHDDQIGPFARMIFQEYDSSILSDEFIHTTLLSTSWSADGAIGKPLALSDSLLIPLYQKIRIRFISILKSIFQFDSILNEIQKNKPSDLQIQFEWDIYLTTVNDFKMSFRKQQLDKKFDKAHVLLNRFPRFLWRATAFQNGEHVLDIIFDATDIEQGANLFTVIEYKRALSFYLRTIFQEQEDKITKLTKGKVAWQIVEWLKKTKFN